MVVSPFSILIQNLSKNLFMLNVNISPLCPNVFLSFLYGIFLSHSEHFATITIYLASICEMQNKHSNPLLLYYFNEKYTPLIYDGTGFANIENGGEIQ
jgi:hypothetical protein